MSDLALWVGQLRCVGPLALQMVCLVPLPDAQRQLVHIRLSSKLAQAVLNLLSPLVEFLFSMAAAYKIIEHKQTASLPNYCRKGAASKVFRMSGGKIINAHQCLMLLFGWRSLKIQLMNQIVFNFKYCRPCAIQALFPQGYWTAYDYL